MRSGADRGFTIRGGPEAKQLLWRGDSRRRGRCELSQIVALIALAQKDRAFVFSISPQTNPDL
ncbi:MAG TPA: hypothetical protein VIC84_18540, partial [Blastocatellia bacterium]